MIIRVFRGTVRPGTEDLYEKHLRKDAFPHFRRQPGFLGLHYGRPTEQAPHEFLVVTAWQDLGAVKRFAGENWTSAKVRPQEAEILVSSSVHHYEDPNGNAAIRLDTAARRVWIHGRRFELPPKEFSVLAALLAAEGRPVSSAELAARVWPPESYATAEDVRRTVYRLRRLIGDHERPAPFIRNRRGYGYVLDAASGWVGRDRRPLRTEAIVTDPTPERPQDAGVAKKTPNAMDIEGAETLANEARSRLSGRGFTDDQISQWAETYVAEESTGDVDRFIAWIDRRQS
ncbi:MAG TPA: winged helix-turn-helix domain-containing protein [Fimbriimonadaceae bacterium]|jgi:DNA-binding winged helix-turn-helix (wHTH) protein/heme-degrading monooxygenase HmoA|nr:winged helix-turn-helix domain-containing protein [Fimbriimonadaceae bacterium]